MQQGLELRLMGGGHEQLDAGDRTQPGGWLEPAVDQFGGGAQDCLVALVRRRRERRGEIGGIEHVKPLDRQAQNVDAATAVVGGRAAREAREIIDPVVRERANSRFTDELQRRVGDQHAAGIH